MESPEGSWGEGRMGKVRGQSLPRLSARHGSLGSSAAPVGQSGCLGLTVRSVSAVSFQVAAKKAIAFCDYINRSLVSGSMWLRAPLHLALVKPYLETGRCEEPSLGAPRGQTLKAYASPFG